MKEKLDYNSPLEIQEASQASKDEFLNSVDILTEKVKVVDVPGGASTRTKPFQLDDGRSVIIFYTLEKAIEKQSGDYTKAQVNISEKGDQKNQKIIFYKLLKDGSIHRFIDVIDIEREQSYLRKEIKREYELWRSGKNPDLNELRLEAEQLLEDLQKSIQAEKDEKEIGLSRVSESELREVNNLLKTLVEQEKGKR